jgi:hypothetical protein
MSDEEYPCDPGYCQIVELYDHIKALTAERDEQIEWVKRLADMQIASEAKLATCEKYRDAYAECDRIGTQAVRDLEAKLAKAVEAIRNVVEEYDLFRKNEYERGLSPLDDEIHEARATLAEIEGEKT